MVSVTLLILCINLSSVDEEMTLLLEKMFEKDGGLFAKMVH